MSADFQRRKTNRSKRRRRKKFDWSVWHQIFLQFHPAFITFVVAISLSCFLIGTFEDRLRPVLLTAARIQTTNAVTVIVEESILSELEKQSLGYEDLIRVERGADGAVTAITTNMTAMNRLRVALVDAMLEQAAQIDEESISIPVGSLIDSELIWGRGPTIKVKSFTIGTVSAEFRSEFVSAGVNQTLHKIWIDLFLPTTVLLPGTQLDVSVETGLCVAETVIVGKVPSYVQKAYG